VIIYQAHARIKVSILLTHRQKTDIDQVLRQSFKFKLFGCKRLNHLHSTIDVSSQIWNHSVALKNRYFKLFKKGLPKAKFQVHLAKLRNRRFPHWNAVGSQSVPAIADRLYLSWEAFFRGDIKRPPTFCKRRKYRSFTLKHAGYKILGHGRIKILGHAYRFNESRAITGQVKTVNVRRDSLRDIYLTFSCDQVPKPEQPPKTGESAGVDFGLKDFLTLSTGEKIAAPLPLKAGLRHLRKAQRVLSRKQKGSKARTRARQDVARVHKKVANVRNDWQWKQAHVLLVMFDFLAFETLHIKAMHQLWGRKVGDLGFADFLLKGQWMAAKLGKELVKIDQWEPTTKTCHLCGHVQDMPLNVRLFVCGGCENVECRDVNASCNILEAGRRLRLGDASKTTSVASVVITAESHVL
jgi:putative transposase